MGDEDQTLDSQNAVETDKPELTDEEQAMAKLKEAITVECEDIGSLRQKLTVTVPRQTLDDRQGEEFAELKRDAMIPGFRKGHAPLKLVEKRFASDVDDRLKTQMITSGYLAAVEKEDIKTLGDPWVWVKVSEEKTGDDGKPRKQDVDKLLPLDKALDHMTLPATGSLTFSCEIEVKPEFELPTLEKIPVSRPQVTIGDEDVEVELKRMRMMSGTYRPVEDGPVERDDLLYADIKVSVGGDVLMDEQNVELAARDVRIHGVPAIGLGDALVGKKKGDSVQIEAEVPDDHDSANLRGKKARFDITVHEIKRLEVPPIDEKFLADCGYDNEDDLRGAMRRNLESRLDRTIQQKMQEQIADYLIEGTSLEIPEGLSQRQTERSVARRTIELYQAGVPQAEIAKAVDEMRVQAHSQTIRDLKLFFVLEKISEQRKIDVGEEQINGAIAMIAQQSRQRFDRVRDKLSKGDGLMTLFLQLRDEKVLSALLADADITETEGPKKKTAKKTGKTSAPIGKPKAAGKTGPSTSKPGATGKAASPKSKPAATGKKTPASATDKRPKKKTTRTSS